MKARNAVVVAGVLLAASAVMAGDAPKFMKDTYPQQGLEAAVNDMMVLQAEGAALSGKVRELVALAVAAVQVKRRGRRFRKSGVLKSNELIN